MAQEFRTFTQRLTKERSRVDRLFDRGETQLFNVRAKTLIDQFGNDIVDAKGKKIWFPENFDPVEAIAYGRSMARLPDKLKDLALAYNLRQGGRWDLQRSYNGQSDAPFASAFQGAASYALGLIGAAAGLSQDRLLWGGGLYNKWANPKTAGPVYGNNPDNVPFVVQGVRDYHANPFAPPATIPHGSLQADPAYTVPGNEFDAAFDHSFNSSHDDFNRVSDSVTTASAVPAARFSGSTPRRYLGRYVADTPKASAFEQGAPAIPYVGSDERWPDFRFTR